MANEQPARPSGCGIGCGLVTMFLVIFGVVGACTSSDDEGAQYDSPGITDSVRDPGYADSLCEGADYLYYDDCR